MFQTPQGDVYLVGGRTSADIARVAGLHRVRRIGPVTVQPGTVAARGASAPELVPPQLRVRPLARPTGASRIPALSDFSWDPAHAASWHFGHARSAQATWSYDASHLYVAFRNVKDGTPFENAGDDPALLHTAGDALVFELSPSQADEQSGTAGALRLVIAPYRAAPVVVLARAPRSDAGRRIDTPVALARLTQSRILDQAQVRMRQGPDGYHVVVAIPQENLGLRLRAGRYTGDFGVVYGAAEPGSVSLRMHWANRDTGLVSDVALQDRLDPQQWGRFEVLPAAEAP